MKNLGNQNYNIQLRFDVRKHLYLSKNKVKMNSEKHRSKSKTGKNKKKSKSRSRSSSDNENKFDNYLDNNLKLELELKDKPEILMFISRLQEIIKKQAKKIKKLKTNIKHYKKKSKVVDVQLKDDIHINNNEELKEPKSLVEEITEAAEKAVQQTGFVYEATSGMYYDFNSGYYYNAELGLYYDGNTGTYLKYNHSTQKYEFHSQVEVVSTKPLEKEIKVKRKKQHKEQEKRAKIKKQKNSSDENLEEGECSSSDNDDNKNYKNGKHTETESDISDQEIAISQSWPPCMRIIVKETLIEKIKVGSLYIITCDGGTIGREGNVSVLLPDINVSKTHAEIKFDKDANSYQITDLGSQNGTILNGKRISEAKQKSQPIDVVHGSLIQFGSTKLLCHIHDGQKTCGHCEPGLIQAETTVKADEKLIINKNTQYKKELKRLKKKFGVETQENTDLAPGYSDRAEERRKVVGSSTDKEKTQASSLEQSIAKENKGFKMLSKMGWSEGQSLGKDGSGLTEPVPIISNPGKTGLGSSPSFSLPMGTSNAAAERKSTVWKKTQQRYQLVQEVNLEAFKDSSSDEEANT